jgi:hypothetical protein
MTCVSAKRGGGVYACLRYSLVAVPADFWESLVGFLVEWNLFVPVARTWFRDCVRVQCDGQRGLLFLDAEAEVPRLTLVCRGIRLVELRSRFHWMLMKWLAQRFPFPLTDGSVYSVCHRCRGLSEVCGRLLRKVLEGKPFFCGHNHYDEAVDFDEDLILSVEDLVRTPARALDMALAREHCETSGAGGPAKVMPVADLCGLAARLVDTAAVLRCRDGGHRAQLWLPVPHPCGTWVAVCEHPAGWHKHAAVDVAAGEMRLWTGNMLALWHIHHRVFEVVKITSSGASTPYTKVSDLEDFEDFYSSLFASTKDEQHPSWPAFAVQLDALSSSPLRWCTDKWLCEEHAWS